MILHETYQELYKKYIEKYCNSKVSHGTFYTLKPFYIRTEMVEFTSKKGITSKHLKPVKKMSFLPDIVSFANSILLSIINHNHLHHYHNAIHCFKDNFDVLYLDIDCSENLSIPVNFEPQSMHWRKDTITVHSGIVKLHGEK